MSFNALGLGKELLNNLVNEKIQQPYPIQEQVIPLIIKGHDVLGIAKTGSGKTASYVLPILQNIQTQKIINNRLINILVLVPTRELAVQVADTFKVFSLNLVKPIKTLAVFGGVSINPQMKALMGVNVLVATPGRLLELVDSNAVQLSQVSTLVLDEADKMLNLGFRDEMNKVFNLLPNKRQNLLFSATLSKDIEQVKELVLNNPTLIEIEQEHNDLDLIKQTAYSVDDSRKGPLLRYLIKEKKMTQVLVFVSSIKRADNVANKLRVNGITAWPIHSKKSQGARTDLLTKFKHGKLQVLVATDLISRGIDIEHLPFVINYELPRSPKDYVHRIGRTGRANSTGEAISLITYDDQHHFKVIQKKMQKEVEFIDTEDFDLKGY